MFLDTQRSWTVYLQSEKKKKKKEKKKKGACECHQGKIHSPSLPSQGLYILLSGQ
jgi:hypothetical protein